MENVLRRKRCYFVQRGTFKENIEKFNTISDLIDLHYMGSAEFEWGALPNSTIRMLVNIDFYDLFTFPEYVNPNGDELKVYAPKMFIDHIKDIVDNLATNSIRLEEYCGLAEHLKGEKNFYSPDFWWDIDNDFYIFFGKEKADMILEVQRNMREGSKDQVPTGDWDKLSEYYSLVNQDLSKEAQDFLKPKKSKLVKRLVKAINTKIDSE